MNFILWFVTKLSTWPHQECSFLAILTCHIHQGVQEELILYPSRFVTCVTANIGTGIGFVGIGITDITGNTKYFPKRP